MRDVFLKEIRDMLRDKRVRSTAFFGPIILVVFLLFLFGSLIGNLSKPQNVRLHVVGQSPSLVEALRAAKFDVIPVASVEAGKKLLTEGKARCVLDILPPVDGVTSVALLYDDTETLSQVAKERAKGVLGAVNQVALTEFIARNNVPARDIAPIKISDQNVAVAQEGGAGEFVVQLLPYLIVIWAFYGGMSVATDLVAGEKERSTLETLLISPVSRTEIIVGKLLALGAICFASSCASLVGLGIYALAKPPGSELLFPDGLGLNFTSIGITVLVLVPLVIFFASLLLAISTYSKNTREAQTYLGIGSFIVVMPAMMSQFIGLTDFGKQLWINLVPVLNSANCIRLALMGKPDWTAVGITVVSSLVLGIAMVAVTLRLFQREEVLTRS